MVAVIMLLVMSVIMWLWAIAVVMVVVWFSFLVVPVQTPPVSLDREGSERTPSVGDPLR